MITIHFGFSLEQCEGTFKHEDGGVRNIIRDSRVDRGILSSFIHKITSAAFVLVVPPIKGDFIAHSVLNIGVLNTHERLLLQDIDRIEVVERLLFKDGISVKLELIFNNRS